MRLAGTVLDRPPSARYLEQLRFAELHLRDPLPKRAALRRWRGELPEGVRLSLRAPREAVSSDRGWLAPTPELTAGVEWLAEAAEALQVSAVVIPTNAEITPGARSRDRLAAYAAALPELAGCRWVWDPHGPWEPETADALASKLGWVRAFDPLQDSWPPHPLAYANLRALGQRRGFSLATLEEIHEAAFASAAEQVLVVVDGPRAQREATQLQQLFDAGS